MWIYLHDKFVKDTEAVISVFDHGFLYGDGVYERSGPIKTESSCATSTLPVCIGRLKRSD